MHIKCENVFFLRREPIKKVARQPRLGGRHGVAQKLESLGGDL